MSITSCPLRSPRGPPRPEREMAPLPQEVFTGCDYNIIPNFWLNRHPHFLERVASVRFRVLQLPHVLDAKISGKHLIHEPKSNYPQKLLLC